MGESYNDRRKFYRVTKTKKNPTWRDKPIVKVGSATMAVQSYIYSKLSPQEYDVKVELVEVVPRGEINMEQYMNRKYGLENFLKKDLPDAEHS